jgi:hypothetical protein
MARSKLKAIAGQAEIRPISARGFRPTLARDSCPDYTRHLFSLGAEIEDAGLSGNGHQEGLEEIEAIRVAEESILSELQSGGEMPPRELRERAVGRTDSRDDVSLAFWRLLNRGKIVLTENRTVRLAA